MTPVLFIHLVPVVLLLLATCYSLWVVVGVPRLRNAPGWLFPEKASRRAKISVAVFAIAVIVIVLILETFFIGVTSAITHELSWSYGDGKDRTCQPEIVLTFVKYPAYYERFCSEDLARHLESLGSKTVVSVEFEITRDFGKVRSINVKRVGNWPHGSTGWRGGGSGCGGRFPPCGSGANPMGNSPWDP